MTSKNDKNSARDQTVNVGDILGGPDPGGREDIMEDITSKQGQEPMPGKDILGGPDGVDQEDVLSAPSRPTRPPSHDVLGGPDSPGTEDIMRPPGDASLPAALPDQGILGHQRLPRR